MTEAVAEQSADHGGDAVEGKENAHAKRLFVARIKHAYNVHDGRADAGFKHSEQEAEGKYACIVFCRHVTAEQERPEKDHGTSILGHRKPLNQKVCGQRPEEVAEVEDGCHPAVAGALEAKVRG